MVVVSELSIAVIPMILEDNKPYIKLVAMEDILNGAIVDLVNLEVYPDGVSAIIDHDGFSLQKHNEEWADYQYHAPYPYKEMPILLEWLKQLDLPKIN